MLQLLLRLSLRNARRRRARSLLTASMVAFGVALLLVALCWMQGIFGKIEVDAAGQAGHVRIATEAFAEREQLMPLHENIADIAPLLTALGKQPGVVAAYGKISTGVTLTAAEEIGDVFGLAVGASPEYFETYGGLKSKLVAGRWFSRDSKQAEEEIVLGAQLAERTAVELGQELVLLGMTQYGSMSPIKGRVTGILDGSGIFGRQVLVPLERLQWLADMEGGATELLVFAEHHGRAVELEESLRGLPALSGLKVQAWSRRAPFSTVKGMTDAVGGIIAAIVVFLVSLGIWNTMMMSVLERTHEIGVMRAMGLRPLGAVAMVMAEAAGIAVVGGLAGLLLGVGPAWWLETHGLSLGEQTARQMGGTIPIEATVYGDLSPGLMLFCFLLGLCMAVLGTTLPALHAAGIAPVAAMRSGR
ncbi:MAG: ABC transporter permease [Myxococcales bacterium]|nr:ABC transporter permease [Myxococcales bacterium]